MHFLWENIFKFYKLSAVQSVIGLYIIIYLMYMSGVKLNILFWILFYIVHCCNVSPK